MKKSSKFLNGLMGFIVVVSIIVVALVFIVPKQFEEYVNDETKLIQDKEELQNENLNSVIEENNDKRILITPENVSQLNPSSDPKCYEKFNRENPNVIEKYENRDEGISIKLPYNAKWGNETYKINPYDKWNDENGIRYILFGPITGFEGCSWARNYALYFFPAKSAEERMEELKQTPNYFEIFIVEPNRKLINGLDVIEYQSRGLCDNGELEIIGKKYNYVLRPLCGSDFEFLESIVESIRFIE